MEGCGTPERKEVVGWLLAVVAGLEGYDWLAEEDADGGASDPGIFWVTVRALPGRFGAFSVLLSKSF